MTPDEIKAEAEVRVAKMRAEIARRIKSKMLDDGIGQREAARQAGLTLSQFNRMVNPDAPKSPNASIFCEQRALIWLGIDWPDVVPRERRDGVIADVEQAIEYLADVFSWERDAIKAAAVGVYRVLREARK